MRLRRLAPGATYQADQHRLLTPVAAPGRGTGYAPGWSDLLAELVPGGLMPGHDREAKAPSATN